MTEASELRVVDAEPAGIAPETCLFVGENSAGRRVVGHAGRSDAGADLTRAHVLFDLPETLPPTAARRALEYWRASRIVEAAGVGVGASVLVLGEGAVSQQVVEVCRWVGALRVDVGDTARPGGASARADSVICLGAPPESLQATFQACRDRGTVVFAAPSAPPADIGFYPDVHKRGLRIRCLALAGSLGALCPTREGFVRLAGLLERGGSRV